MSIIHYIATLKMPSKIAEKIEHLQVIQSSLTGNTNFPASVWPAGIVSLPTFTTNVANLAAAEIKVKNKTGPVAARTPLLKLCEANAKTIMASVVQVVADNNATNAEAIITSGGYGMKPVVITKQKQVNGAYNTQIAGTVLLTREGKGHTEYRMSKDKITIIGLPGSSAAHTFVPSLTVGTTNYFSMKPVNTTKKTYDWCPWIELQIGAGGKNTGKSGLTGTAFGAATT